MSDNTANENPKVFSLMGDDLNKFSRHLFLNLIFREKFLNLLTCMAKVNWGNIEGTLAEQADLQAALTVINNTLGVLQAAYVDLEERMDAEEAELPSSGGGVVNMVIIDDVNYTLAAGVTNILYKTLTAARVITLGTPTLNRKVRITNGPKNFALSTTETLRLSSTGTTSTLNIAGWVDVVGDGTEWWIIGSGV